MKPCIFIVDDEESFTWSVERFLSAKGYEVVRAHSGKEAIKLLHRHHPDVVLLDILMPNMSGVEVCQRIRADRRLDGVLVVFLTVKEEVEAKLEGFKAGADDYLTKPIDLRELSARVDALLRLKAPVKVSTNGDSLKVGRFSLNPAASEVSVNGKTVSLTRCELRLLNYLLLHSGEVISSERLLREVWNYPPGAGSPALVRFYIKSLRRKIEPVPNQPVFLLTVSNQGYRLVPGGVRKANL